MIIGHVYLDYAQMQLHMIVWLADFISLPGRVLRSRTRFWIAWAFYMEHLQYFWRFSLKMQELKKDRRRDPKPGFGSQIPAASLPQQRDPGYVPALGSLSCALFLYLFVLHVTEHDGFEMLSATHGHMVSHIVSRSQRALPSESGRVQLTSVYEIHRFFGLRHLPPAPRQFEWF